MEILNVKRKADGADMVINEGDFDEALHEMAEPPAAEPAPEPPAAEPAPAKASASGGPKAAKGPPAE